MSTLCNIASFAPDTDVAFSQSNCSSEESGTKMRGISKQKTQRFFITKKIACFSHFAINYLLPPLFLSDQFGTPKLLLLQKISTTKQEQSRTNGNDREQKTSFPFDVCGKNGKDKETSAK